MPARAYPLSTGLSRTFIAGGAAFLGNQTRDQLDLDCDVEGQFRHADGTA